MADEGQTPAGPELQRSAVPSDGLGNGGKGPSVDGIMLDGLDTTFILGGDQLLIKSRSPTKPDRICCLPSRSSATSRSILYYHVLWAELSATSLQIEVARPHAKTGVRVESLRYSIAEDGIEAANIWIETLLVRAYGRAKRRRRAKVLVNPHAGQGDANKKWTTEAEPLFLAARSSLDVQSTTYSGEAIAISENLDIDAYDTIIACSGDGLPYEIFNGLGRRPDARTALFKLAISHIPCGSGNAMSCNLYGTHNASLAALAIIKGVRTPMDLVSVTQGEKRTLSFLSQSLGIIAESDLATENLRWMGSARFTYGFMARILKKVQYPCDLAVKVEIEHKEGIREHYAREWEGEPLLREDGEPSVMDSSSSDTMGEALPPLRYGMASDKLPDGWELIPHDTMGGLYCGNMAYMAPDANFFPASCINDGYMDLILMNADLSLPGWVSVTLAVGNGKAADTPLLSYRKISGFRVVPKNQADGYISVDGERVPFEPLQAEVHRGLATVISKRGRYEAPGPGEPPAKTDGKRKGNRREDR